jgi:hypothetical protein
MATAWLFDERPLDHTHAGPCAVRVAQHELLAAGRDRRARAPRLRRRAATGGGVGFGCGHARALLVGFPDLGCAASFHHLAVGLDSSTGFPGGAPCIRSYATYYNGDAFQAGHSVNSGSGPRQHAHASVLPVPGCTKRKHASDLQAPPGTPFREQELAKLAGWRPAGCGQYASNFSDLRRASCTRAGWDLMQATFPTPGRTGCARAGGKRCVLIENWKS